MKLYVVVPCYNEEEGIIINSRKILEYLNVLIDKNVISNESKIIFVDDGSTDRTAEYLNKIYEHDRKQVVCIYLAHNSGHQNALIAGYLYCKDKCDACISIDADLQQDITAIDAFINQFKLGRDVVYGIRNDRKTDSFFKKYTASFFYKLMSFMGCDIFENCADYRLISNKVLRYISEYKEKNIFLRALIPRITQNHSFVWFNVTDREYGKSKYTTRKMFQLAIDGITSFTIKPMLYILILGCTITIIGLLNIIHSLIVYFARGTVEEWTTIVSSIWFIGGLLLIGIGMLGIYIGKTYIETKDRPRFHIDRIDDTE